MNRDDIIRLAWESGTKDKMGVLQFCRIELEAFAILVAEAEREACARVCEEHSSGIHGYDKHGYADAIRARGEK